MVESISAANILTAKIFAFIRLVRPLNCLITGLSVCVGALTGGVFPPDLNVLIASASASLVAAAGYAFNDVVDLDIDRLNRPGRPLPAGRISPKFAALGAQFLALVGLFAAWWLSPTLGLFASVVAGSLFLYSRFLKMKPLWGNLVVALLAGSAFPYGALAGGGWGRSWIPGLFAFLFHLGREIVKDLEDLEGDRLNGAQTLPIRWGAARAGVLATIVFLVLAVVVLFPWFSGIYRWHFLLSVLLVNLLTGIALLKLWRSRLVLHEAKVSRLLTAGMFLGLAAIVVGELLS
jgi:geranylgeranylglycerol-phosphate geranylgeranyltransferase